ncbi:MAG TPA: hypothetical protein VHG91_11890 [Longimicrobium sp.]|nr:hypothetical protein [Longimicrobium sp.]
MKKIKLNLDSLGVDSFDTGADAGEKRRDGTVQAHATGFRCWGDSGSCSGLLGTCFGDCYGTSDVPPYCY